MTHGSHLLLHVPENWSNDQKGDFFETFVAEILRPMRFKVTQRLRVTGMEIDLLARGEDQQLTLLVECKAHRDPLPSDVISKLLGNVTIRHADAGWLFTTSDLGKDGRGQWEDISSDPELARRFTWFSPERIVEVLLAQSSIIHPDRLLTHLAPWSSGDWTLVVLPGRRVWLAQIVEDGLPTRFAVFDAKTGDPVPASVAQEVATASPRFASLRWVDVSENEAHAAPPHPRPPVARVVSGDGWDDPRPARPADFVGREDLIKDVVDFLGAARQGSTATRTFAVQGPSGWGKSSLTLKLSDLARRSRIAKTSLTAIDSRSATNSAFVSEALRQALLDAHSRGLLPDRSDFRIQSLRDPLDSPDVMGALEDLREREECIVLIFDQFEELFAKEPLFETFNAVRELSLDIDARQAPIILGFAWKTDISLPQQHPAYHLWHQLGDRRRTFKIREFDGRDVRKIIGGAERGADKRLAPALRARLVEKCQGFPWLLKKLLVHVLQRVSEAESQYLLLERELDVEMLFKEDLAVLGEEAIRCLRFVAARAPVAVAEVEENFPRDTTNLLINAHLLVRSGMNYVVYWDIFRDYLVEGRVPYIPWARTFQRGPAMAIKALQKLEEAGEEGGSAATLAGGMGLREGTCFNLLADLVALQLAEPTASGSYKPGTHLGDLQPATVARHVQGQLRRHVVVREMATRWERDRLISPDDWYLFFAQTQPGAAGFSNPTIHSYANNLKAWLLFSGILEQRNRWYSRPGGSGAQFGELAPRRRRIGTFLGGATPASLIRLLERLCEAGGPLSRGILVNEGLRNAVADAAALGLATAQWGVVALVNPDRTRPQLVRDAKDAILVQPAIETMRRAEAEGVVESEQIGRRLEEALGVNWQRSSALRNVAALRRYFRWASDEA